MSPDDPLAPLTAMYVHGIAGVIVPLALCLAALKVCLLPMLKGKLGEAVLSLRLRRLGFPAFNNLVLKATDGTYTQVDHVVLTARGVLAIETKNYRGTILASATDRQWTKVIGRQKNRFQNPLRQNFKHVAALRALVGSQVNGLVVFVGEARFPKGLPNGAVTLREFDRHLLEFGLPDGPPEIDPAWRRVTAAAGHSRSLQAAHGKGIEARFGPDRRIVAALLCLGAAAVLFVYAHMIGSPDTTIPSLTPAPLPHVWSAPD